jgi:glycosyltransferase involved in cell wall biosynthesis
LTTLWSDYFPDPGPQEDILKLYDVLFVSCHEGIDLWKSRGVEEVHWLPFAFDDLLETKIPETREVELAFVGAINLPIHAIRREYLGALVKRFRMNDFQRRYSQAEAGAVYAGAKMVVNITELRGFNMRNFEAMGQGALLLTQKTGYGIPEMFQDGVHLVVYDGIEDLVEKATYYLQHEEERMRIAEAGQKEILAKHTYRHRAQEFLRVAASYAGRQGIGRKRANAARGYANFYRHHRRIDKLVEVLCGRGLDLQQRAEVLLQTISCLGGLCRSGRTVNFH